MVHALGEPASHRRYRCAHGRRRSGRRLRYAGETVAVVTPLDEDLLRRDLAAVLAKARASTAPRWDCTDVCTQGIRSLAVCLLHSYTFRDHEQRVGAIARQLGFTHVSLSSAIMPMVKVRGAHCACVVSLRVRADCVAWSHHLRRRVPDPVHHPLCGAVQGWL